MNPLHRLPSLSALRAFEAVARHSSFSRAAQELHVTKAAVAEQVRSLEQEIGARLVERNGRGLQLTKAGAAGAAPLAEGFALLAKAARAMREGEGRRFLIINSAPSFAATWLVGRIGKFKARHPGTDVLIDANPIDEALDSGAADALTAGAPANSPASRRRFCSRRMSSRSARRNSSRATIRCARRTISRAIPCCTSTGIPRTPRGPPGRTGSRRRAR